MNDEVKSALLDGSATILTKIDILPSIMGEEMITLTEVNSIISWDYEDFRYVKNEGFIGQFVARQVNGVIKNINDTFSITDKEFELQIGIKIVDDITWYSLGNFMVNKVTDDEVNDKTSFEALDYTKKFNKKFEDRMTYPCTALELVQDICNQCNVELGQTNFKHNDWIIEGNAFTNGESCRDVMKEIGKLAYSWVRIDWNNKVYLDFTKEAIVEDYNTITNHEYYSLTTQKDKFIVNRVVIGYSEIEGERTKVEDLESIEENGLCEITIFDNPLVYNQELREKAIIGAEDLLGLEYTPLNTLTVGHPWLKGKELIEVVDMEGIHRKTIPFDRTIKYFGHIKTLIDVNTNTKTNTEFAYNSGIESRFRKVEVSVNKIDGQITEVIEEQTETTNKLNQTIATVDGTQQVISSLETNVSDNISEVKHSLEILSNSTQQQLNVINQTIENGVTKVVTTSTTLDENGLAMEKTGEQMSLKLDWDGMDIIRDKGKGTETNMLTVRSDGVNAENITVRTYLIQRPIRTEKCTSISDGTSVGLGDFWIGE